MNKKALQELMNNNIDIAEDMLNSSNIWWFLDILDEHNINIESVDAKDLLSRCHSVVAEEITNWCKERLG